jgi:hypothetical protein
MYLSQIPGYSRAAQRGDRLDDYWRDFAFLGLNEELRIPGGRTIEVRQLTLRMFVQLCAVRSPFLVGGGVGPQHVAQILWRLSPKYDLRANDPEARKKFVASIADLPFRATTRAIARYLDRMLIDKPPQPARSNDSKSDTSFAASMIHHFAKEYGWNDEEILDLPMPRLFQYLRKIQRSHDPELSFWNPLRDRFTKKVTDKYLAKRRGE